MNEPTVFVVDDEVIIATTLAKILAISGFDAKAFTNPLEALEATTNDEPALLVSDVYMPEMLGTNLAINIKQRNPTCRVLLFSGNASTSDLLRDAAEQGYDFTLLSKPIHPADLIAKLRDCAG